MLRFTDIHESGAGVLASLLRQAYAELLTTGSAQWKRESERWDEFDRVAYSSTEIGRCVFLTWYGNAIVGFGSFDPRGAPQRARVGHNCIIPAFQRRGFGRRQLEEVLRRLLPFSVPEIHAFTLDLPFFAAAHRLYESAGFRVIERTPWKADSSSDVLHFAKR